SDTSSESDILIQDGTVSLVGAGLSENDADRVIDADGLYIFPGGVDPHVHMHLSVAAGYSSDDFLSGSQAALYGGTTCILDFVTPARGESLPGALEKRKKEAEKSMIDYSFHVSPVEWRRTTGPEIMDCIRMGATSFKVYMAYKDTIGLSDDDLLKAMEFVGKAGGMVSVHCEMGDEIEKLQDRYFFEGHTSPYYHALSRPPEVEAKAVKRAVAMARKAKCPLYIVHVSSGESLKYIREAQSLGQRVYAETCPQYLLLDNSKYNGEFDQTAPYVISPPLRTAEDNDALWDAVADGTISTIGTDHCPFTMKQKRAGISDFRMIPGGAGGVEHRLSLLYTYGVLADRISLNRMVELLASAPARIFGLYPAKGEILPGSDADLVIWNPNTENIISARSHHQNCDINIYEGIPVRGNADYVIAGGRIIIDQGKMTDIKKSGKYLFRTIFDPPSHLK
ncbi:MAG: dihydropyrimidinase, partial [Bacteroidales bacterium]